MTRARVCLLLAGALSLSLVPSATTADGPRLQYVVIVTRHGVRAPTWPTERLNQYSSAPWPDWGVAPADLTPRGRTLVALMGSYYRDWLTANDLLESAGCQHVGSVFIWADTDQRTLETGHAIADSLMPGCGVAVHSGPPDTADPLFDPIAAGFVHPDPTTAAQAIRDRIGPDPGAFLRSSRAAFESLDSVLNGDSTSAQRPFKTPAPVTVSISGGAVELGGPLNTASTLTENLLLEYANGFAGQDLGWGRVDTGTLVHVLELHGRYADLMRRTKYLAQARGSNLLAHIVRSLEQAATGRPTPGALGSVADRVLILSGHDTNQSNISGMLDLSWRLDGYPRDETPPGGALVFSLWRDVDGSLSVQTRYVAQTLDQMHRGDRVSLAEPPAFEDLDIPGCRVTDSTHACAWDDFVRVVERSINPDFVRD